jgi:hypothetical protein
MIKLVMEVTTGSWFSAAGRASILSGIERLMGPCSSFVCFGASWRLNCCTCSRQQMARTHRRLLILRQVHLERRHRSGDLSLQQLHG